MLSNGAAALLHPNAGKVNGSRPLSCDPAKPKVYGKGDARDRLLNLARGTGLLAARIAPAALTILSQTRKSALAAALHSIDLLILDLGELKCCTNIRRILENGNAMLAGFY